MATISGSFSGTGQSAVIYGKSIDIAMDFGSGSVDVERQVGDGGAWIKIATAVTADYNYVAEFPAPVSLRLNCTAWVSTITYVMQTHVTDSN